ncbi:MAG: exosortase A [Propionivibrio sp.]|nr:exosortase A [Propionivibrio sp.]
MALLAMAVTLLAILVVYRETALSMVAIWERSETFTHGFLVPPITLWLIWRLRKDVAVLAPRPNVWVLLVLGCAGFVWLLAELATVAVLSQFALTTMLVLAVPAILGLPVARRIAFPLAFLYFAVPFGEFALPQLMEWTAHFTVLGLRLSGIPVYREGLHFIIPSGSWSVVEACSGVRYIIASLTVGTLFAYLTYHSLKRRLAFVCVAIVVPVIANWMRAYMIVMIGHLSGNKLAVGVDHLIYGWLFFGVVIVLMFWIGSRWREDEHPPAIGRADSADSTSVNSQSSSPVVGLAAIVVALIWPLAEWQIDRNIPPQVTYIEPFEAIAGWNVTEKFTDWSPSFTNPSTSLQSAFGSDGRTIGLFVGYYRNQEHNRKLVSANNVIVANNDPKWLRVASGLKQLDIGKEAISVRTAELRSTDTQRIEVWQWYWINGHQTSSDLVAKAYTALSRLVGHGDDSAVILVYAPKEQGDTSLEAFVQVAEPAIMNALDRTRDKR